MSDRSVRKAEMRLGRAGLLAAVICVSLAGCDGPTRSPAPGGEDACGGEAGWLSGAGYVETMSPGAVPRTYEPHGPILIEDVHATASDPYVVEGYEISSSRANCIEVRNSENVVIRNNYLHDCTWSRDQDEPHSEQEGFAILIGRTTGVVVEGNVLERNKMGVAAHTSTQLALRHNTIETTQLKSSVRLERVQGAVVVGNYLADNGIPEQFWAPGHRNIGIFIVRSDDVEVRDNVVIRSTSDGISVGGQIDGGGLTSDRSDWTGTASRIHIHNNLILDNMELGIWLVRARSLDIHHNTIRNGCFTHGSGIGLDFDVDGSRVYANEIVTCLNRAHISLVVSHDNHIHDNVHYSTDGHRESVKAHDDLVNDQIKADWSGIPLIASSGNRIEADHHLELGDPLRQVLVAKLDLAVAERTWEEKGWFSCEEEEGVFDQDCVAGQAALGEMGVPRQYLIIDPLMPDPGLYAGGCP